MAKAKTRKTMLKENTTPEVVDNKVEGTFSKIKVKNILYWLFWIFLGIALLPILSTILLFIPYFCKTVVRNHGFQISAATLVNRSHMFYLYILSIFYFVCISKFFKLKTTTHKLIKTLYCYILALGLCILTGYALKYTVGIRFCHRIVFETILTD